jgi:hypothetical protein
MPAKKGRTGARKAKKPETEVSPTIDQAAGKEPAAKDPELSGKMFAHVCFSFRQDAFVAPEFSCLNIVFVDGVYFTESPAGASKTGEASQASEASSSQASAPRSSQVPTPVEEASQGDSQGEASQVASQGEGRQNHHMNPHPLSLLDLAGVEEQWDGQEHLKLYEAIKTYTEWAGSWKLEEFHQRSAIKYELQFHCYRRAVYRVIDTSDETFATRNFGFRAVSFADVRKLAMKMINAGGWDGEHNSPLIVWRDQDK